MKKVLAIIIVLCMALTILAACGDSGSSDSPPPANTADGGGGGADGGGGASTAGGPKEIGFYDRDYDYTQHERFRFNYLVSAASFYGDAWDLAFAAWADRLNMNYGGIWAPAEASNEAFLSGVETHADMGFKGLILDGDVELGPRVAEILANYDVIWMWGMSQARDPSKAYTINGEYVHGPLLTPNVGFNNIMVGRTLAARLLDWKEEAYPDVPWEEVGFVATDFSIVPQLNQRQLGNKMEYAERLPQFGAYSPEQNVVPRNFVVADAAAFGFDQAAGINLTTQIFSDPAYSHIKVWLVSGLVLDLALGASIAAENMGIQDFVCTTTFGGGEAVTSMWENGEPTAIRFSLETAAPVFVEAIINGLWAMLAGFATPDTLWPDWQIIWDKGDVYQTSGTDPNYPNAGVVEFGADGNPIVLESRGFASMILPMIWVDPDNLAAFGGWADLYEFGPNATDEERNYPQYPLGTDINLFNARGTVPAYFNEWP